MPPDIRRRCFAGFFGSYGAISFPRLRIMSSNHSWKDVRWRYSWHSRSHDAVIRDYDEPGNMIDTHKHFAATAPENSFVESFS
jgi:hypothetical protein